MFHLEKATDLALHVGIPYRTTTAAISVNGEEQPLVGRLPGTCAVISRQWRTGEVLKVALRSSLYSELLPDNRRYVGLKCGPHTLVACAAPGSTFDGTAAQLVAALRPAAPSAPRCNFTLSLRSQCGQPPLPSIPLLKWWTRDTTGTPSSRNPPLRSSSSRWTWATPPLKPPTMFRATASTVGSSRHLAYRDAQYDGFIAYSLQVDPTRRCYLRVLYDGDVSSDQQLSSVFDLQLLRPEGSYGTFATHAQSQDRETPNDWYKVLYPLPVTSTQGQSSVTIRFQANGFNGEQGAIGRLYDQFSTFAYAET